MFEPLPLDDPARRQPDISLARRLLGWEPAVSLTEGLRVEAQHFLECIRHDRQPLTNGQSALRVIRVLEAAVQSLEQGGRPIELPPVEPLPLPAVATEQAV